MKILRKEPEEIQCPPWLRNELVWNWGKQAVLDQVVEVDLNARAIGWLARMLEDDDLRGLLMARDLKPITFEDYLEEQLKEEK